MLGPLPSSKNSSSLSRVKLSDRNFAPRQKALLDGIWALCVDEFGLRTEQMLNHFEQQLFQDAEQARNNEVQRVLLETQILVRENKGQYLPLFLAQLETSLATLADPAPAKKPSDSQVQFSELSLVDTQTMDEAVALKEIGTRIEIRNSLPLFLLGQRLGVVARRPAFDSEALPLGPYQLCQALRNAASVFGMGDEYRGALYRQFERHVAQTISAFYEALNNYLIEQGVLPHLTYIPPRNKPAARKRETLPSTNLPQADTAAPLPETPPDPSAAPARSGGMPGVAPAPSFAPAASTAAPQSPGFGLFPPQGQPAAPTPSAPAYSPAPMARADSSASSAHPVVPWNNVPTSSDGDSQDVELFDTLRKLLSGRRNLLGRLKPSATSGKTQSVSTTHVQESLAQLQQIYNQNPATNAPIPFSEIKRDLMLQLYKGVDKGHTPQLSEEQGDTVDLIGLLFEQIAQEVRPESPGGGVMAQLQLPLLRVAIQDQDFFTDREHPARQLLNTIAETTALWSSEDDVDRDLIQKMNLLVRRANTDDSGDLNLYRELMADMSGHLATQQRKAEISERRHVDAARGREKLEIARIRAEEVITEATYQQNIPKLLKTLLEKVWVDVLALNLLRGGEESPAFQQQITLIRQLIKNALPDAPTISPAETAALRSEVEAGLAQVGYVGSAASDICERLLSPKTSLPAAEPEPTDSPANVPQKPATSDAPSRTELTIALTNRDRLGQDVRDERSPAGPKTKQFAPLANEEKVWHERLKRLPYGSWFDFTINQQGDQARRRMSWYSIVTDHCLFVNHRGQRAGDYTLSWLAREITRGNVKLVEAERLSIVDRAWKAIMASLRTFSRGGGAATADATS